MSECSHKYESDFGLPPACVKCGAEPTQPSEVGPFIEIIFDASNGPMNMVFVEVENEKGQSVNVGEWHDQADGYSALRIPLGQSTARSQEGRVKELEAQILDLKQLVDQGRKLADKQLEVHAQESQTFLSEITKLSGQEGRLRELQELVSEMFEIFDEDSYGCDCGNNELGTCFFCRGQKVNNEFKDFIKTNALTALETAGPTETQAEAERKEGNEKK